MFISDRIILSLLTVVLFSISGCASVYIPSAQHTHLMNKKGELHAAAYGGTNGTDIQGAYAISDRMGLVAAASFGSSDEEGDDDYHKHSYIELGATYFRPLGNIGRYEALGGLGAGSSESVTQYNFFGPQKVQATGDYTKIFVQNNFGLETGPLETGLALRLSHVVFTEFETSGMTYNESEAGTFFEPAIFARLGWKNVKVETQVGVLGPLQESVAFDYRVLNISLGLNFWINTQ